jgi:hypothetical protein
MKILSKAKGVVPIPIIVFLALFLSTYSWGGGSSSGGGSSTIFDSAAIDDLNDDGIPDVAIASKRINGPPPHPGRVLVKFQDLLSPGTFSSAVKFRVGHDPLAVATDDINGDGLTDLVTANSSDDNISVLLQDPAMPGNFLAANDFVVGNYPEDLAIGDQDGDSLVDIAIADNSLSILFQDPASIGNFLPRASLGIGSGSVAIGDLDGDLLADLAATSANPGVVRILLQDPATPGTFLPAVEYTAGDQPIHVAIGDLDGDTLPDLAVANLGEPDGGGNRGVSVLLARPEYAWKLLTCDRLQDGRQCLWSGDWVAPS